MPDWH